MWRVVFNKPQQYTNIDIKFVGGPLPKIQQ